MNATQDAAQAAAALRGVLVECRFDPSLTTPPPGRVAAEPISRGAAGSYPRHEDPRAADKLPLAPRGFRHRRRPSRP
ncbi:MAG: hypothetical protein L0H59_15110, partial [Tomitella sp.]|nr:hypothetical protein [Tomitella sp.]